MVDKMGNPFKNVCNDSGGKNGTCYFNNSQHFSPANNKNNLVYWKNLKEDTITNRTFQTTLPPKTQHTAKTGFYPGRNRT